MLWLGLHYPALGLEALGLGTRGLATKGLEAQGPSVSTSASTPTSTPTSTAGPEADNEAITLIDQGQVLLCNPLAAQQGIHPGMTAATANTVVSGLKQVQRSTVREAQSLKALAETLYQLTPQVALEPPSALLLEISASLRLFGSAHSVKQQALSLSQELGHQARARLAATPAAALALARTGARTLAEVSLRALQLNPQDVERFVNMGLQTLGQVIELPSRELAQRFGSAVVLELQRLSGQQSDPKTFIRLSPEFNRTLELLDPIRNKQGLLLPMQQLAGILKHWLISQQLAAGQLHWQFAAAAGQGQSSKPAKVLAEFARPHQNLEKMLQISQLRLEQTALPADVMSLSLQAARLTPYQPGAKDLFAQQHTGGQQGAADSSPDELLDQLKARLGAGACRQLEAIDQHHPAWLSRQPVKAAYPNQPRKNRQPLAALPSSAAQQAVHTLRPLWLCRPPRSVAAAELQLLHGPERIRTAWWHAGICRDYYIAQHRQHAHCWVFTDDSGHWFIHGYFG